MTELVPPDAQTKPDAEDRPKAPDDVRVPAPGSDLPVADPSDDEQTPGGPPSDAVTEP